MPAPTMPAPGPAARASETRAACAARRAAAAASPAAAGGEGTAGPTAMQMAGWAEDEWEMAPPNPFLVRALPPARGDTASRLVSLVILLAIAAIAGAALRFLGI